ncbi:hypothetical protein [Pseudomonas fluorescens]|uniref:hypothetical protein n=1 Tax=Pseudomonas fluorescens TaxID=294 RepID=UPI00123FFCDA|nr:hypothetical protein [Pseudomonas fluorescens]
MHISFFRSMGTLRLAAQQRGGSVKKSKDRSQFIRHIAVYAALASGGVPTKDVNDNACCQKDAPL